MSVVTLEVLEQTRRESYTRIADLCELRQRAVLDIEAKTEAAMAGQLDADLLLTGVLNLSCVTSVIDAEIELLSEGLKKLHDQIACTTGWEDGS